MNIISSYKVKIKDLNHCFSRTVEIYNKAISFFSGCLLKGWSHFESMTCAQVEN